MVLVVLAGLGALPQVVPPEWVTDLLLRQLGPGLQLELTRHGPANWHLRGGPTLEVHGLDITQTGTDIPWLHADRVLLALPWRTVRSPGNPLALTRIEVDAPKLNLPPLRRWLDSRTPGTGQTPLPTLTNGLEITDGQLHGDAWKIDAISVQLPVFSPGTPVRGKFFGQYTNKTTRAEFDLRLAMTRPALPAGVAIVGNVNLQRDTTSIPAQLTLSGPLQFEHGQWRVPALHLVLEGEWFAPDSPAHSFALNLDGTLTRDKTICLAPLTLELTGSGPLPSLYATGEATLNEHLHLTGEMPRWPDTWPTLPAPLGQHNHLGFTLDYIGPMDMSGQLHLQLYRGPTRLEAALYPSELANWLSRTPSSPLPPLQGRLSTPTLELSGATLSGIVIESEP